MALNLPSGIATGFWVAIGVLAALLIASLFSGVLGAV